MTEFARFARMAGGDGVRLTVQGTMQPRTPWWLDNGEVAAPDWFRGELAKCEGEKLTVVIDSPGGDVGAGIAMYTLLRQRRGETCAEVIRAYSAATLVLAGCDKGKRLLSPAATLLYHNPMTYAEGDWREMDKAERFLSALKKAVIAAYQEASGMDADTLAALMDAETIYTAQEAIAAGWADGLLPAAEAVGAGGVSLKGALAASMTATEDMVRAALAEKANADQHRERAEILRWAESMKRKD